MTLIRPTTDLDAKDALILQVAEATQPKEDSEYEFTTFTENNYGWDCLGP